MFNFSAAIERIQKAREEAEIMKMEEKQRINDEKERLAKEDLDRKREEEELVQAEEEEKKRKLREDRLKKREEKRGDSWISGEDEVSLNESDLSTTIKKEDLKEENSDDFSTKETDLNKIKQIDSVNEVKTEIKSEVTDEIESKINDKKPGDSLLTTINHKVRRIFLTTALK